jgi:hypothetical protein
MFTITDQNEVKYNGKTVTVCNNESETLQTAINLSHKYGQLAEFQVEKILFSK